MAYSTLWGSKNPGHIVYLVDLSESMSWRGKYEMVMDSIRDCLRVMAAKSISGSVIRERFTVSIIGYNSSVYTLFKGGVKDVVEMQKKAAKNDNRIFWEKSPEGENGKGKIVPENAKPRWQTYMADGLRAAKKDIEEWINHPIKSENTMIPAPIVISITDGHPEESGRTEEEATADAAIVAEEIKNLKTPDGNVLLFCIHIDPDQNMDELVLPVDTPSDKRRQFLFEISSVLPSQFVEGANAQGLPAKSGSRGMVSNAKNKNTLVRFINFGSTSSMAGGIPETPKE